MKNKSLASKIESFVAIAIVAFLFICLLSMAYNGLILSLQKHNKIPRNASTGQTAIVDYLAIYPKNEENQIHYEIEFPDYIMRAIAAENDAQNSNTNEWNNSKFRQNIRKLEAPYFSIMDQLEKKVNESTNYIPGYYFLSELSSRTDRILGKAYFDENTEVYALPNGQLMCLEPKSGLEDIRNEVKNIVDFAYYLDEKNIDFMYLQYPYKQAAFCDEIPDGVEDFYNYNTDNFLEYLSCFPINSLDLRQTIREDNADCDSLYFKSDHHWNTLGGKWGALKLAEYLNDKYEYNLDTSLLNQESFKANTLEKYFLGSNGRTVTLANSSPDDFTLYVPIYETNFEMINDDMGVDITGTFEEVMVDYNRLNKKDYYKNICYDTLVYGNRPLTKIKNLDNGAGPKILLIRDSYSLAMAPYLALMVSELDLIDVRNTVGNFEGSVKTFIDVEKPDIVILMTNTGYYNYF